MNLHKGNIKNKIKDPFVKKLNQEIINRNTKLKKELAIHITQLKKLI